MTTMDDFIAQFTDVQRDVIRDNGAGDGKIDALCHILHRDLGLPETPMADDDPLAEALIASGAEPGSIEMTVEHAQLHDFMLGVATEARMSGMGITNTLTALFLIGRRYGMREAAQALATLDDTPGTPQV